MVENMENGCDGSQWAVETQQQGDQPEVADGGVGQQALEVILEHGAVGAEEEGERAGTADDPEPFFAAGQRGPQAGQQEHAGLHHRRRMQIRRHRRGGGHRVGQPEVEGELGAFAQGADQYQGEHDRVQRMGANLIARRQHPVQVIAADDMPQQHHARQQAQAAGAGDHQRHVCAASRIGAVVPIANQ